MNGAAPMQVAAFDGTVCRIIEEELFAFDVEQARAVRRGEVLEGQHMLRWPKRNDPACKKHHMVGHVSFRQVVGRHQDGAASLMLVMDHRVDRPG